MSILNETKEPIKPKLVQSTLSKAFFSLSRTAAACSTSPYFLKSRTPVLSDHINGTTCDNDSNQNLTSTPINLYSERRASLTPFNLSSPSTTRSAVLARTAAETKSLLPNLLKTTPHAPTAGILYNPANLHELHTHRCPHLPRTPIRVLNADSIDAALALPSSTLDRKPPLILNMANAKHGGGGWLRGALAQEESLCYRSSLSFTLKKKFYPLLEEEGIYSPTVVVFRDSLANGHSLLDLSQPQDLSVVSVISVAAVRDPELVVSRDGEEVYKHGEDRTDMKKKMRVVLRAAGREGHRRIILGALGCGAFGNPNKEVARCWKEVLAEAEFSEWWESIIFAVMEDGDRKDGDGNYGVFLRELDGMLV